MRSPLVPDPMPALELGSRSVVKWLAVIRRLRFVVGQSSRELCGLLGAQAGRARRDAAPGQRQREQKDVSSFHTFNAMLM